MANGGSGVWNALALLLCCTWCWAASTARRPYYAYSPWAYPYPYAYPVADKAGSEDELPIIACKTSGTRSGVDNV